MKELNAAQIMEVSGAGKIQDGVSSWYGSLFSGIFKLTSSFSSALGATEEAAKTNGEELGSKIGAKIEDAISTWVDQLSALIK
ncbi:MULTISPECIES: hypothetical protein [Erwinia]|uniref:Uncharacterized protein n=2 Tax=Erwinia TaxID=551 RepID=A0A014N5U1_9GAMM|nr:hypothetical protein [Erwinia mallotivora]EXU74733.1 hypothetical protein BG55_15315 [Erwinia mallotivora]